MKATNNVTNTQKPSQDIRNNSLFTEITAELEVFVRGGAPSRKKGEERTVVWKEGKLYTISQWEFYSGNTWSGPRYW
ncbi:hypothetical protein PA905_12050 [Planktothrix agardhii CCAP 1459/11A]|uniref:Uncharacterized protein n=1 Tax=Planktothrix agardhii CCAP 1459/11A TaxID=282420 RepID=A0A4V0XUC6_PLAAG|nr:hypothetical protein [Planktothrix agardhii]GDZ93369.1 hypothetical protein PA905_12050 [Planktothrix agardhii CCAP 1459/11A]